MPFFQNSNDESSKLLIIDDEEEILESLRRRFELEGILVRTCQNPEEALNLMTQNHYNIVITDIKMPKMNGIELLNALKNVNPLCNIIMITGFSNMSFVVECLSSGACDYFTKPFDNLDILVEATQQAIKRVYRWKESMGFAKGRLKLCKT